MFTWQPACFSTVDWVVWPTVNHYSRSYQQMVELRNSSTFEWNHHSLESIQKRFRGANGSACKDLRILNFQPQLLQMQQARATNNARNQSFRGSKREYCVDHYVQFGMATCRRYYLVALSRAVAAEAEYIAEWLDYHLSVGFDKFIILNKDVTGGVEQILRPYMEQGSVEEIYREVKANVWDEFPGFKETVKKLHGEAFWFVWIDLDEFWVPPSWADNLRDAIMPFTNMRTASSPKAFHGHWLTFGESPWAQRPAPGTPVTVAFTRRHLKTHPMSKQLSLIDAVDFDAENWSMHSIELRDPYRRSGYNMLIGPLILWWESFEDIAILTHVSFCSQSSSACSGTSIRDILFALSLLLFLRSALGTSWLRQRIQKRWYLTVLLLVAFIQLLFSNVSLFKSDVSVQ